MPHNPALNMDRRGFRFAPAPAAGSLGDILLDLRVKMNSFRLPAAFDVLLVVLMAAFLLMTAKTGVDLVNLSRMSEKAAAPAPASRPAPPVLTPEMIEALRRLEDNTGIRTEVQDEGIRLVLTETLLYASGKAALSADGRKLLKRVIPVLSGGEGKIRIEGHSDDRPIRRSRYKTNIELSMARALQVARHLVESGKISADRISATGYGAKKPVYPNDSPSHRAENRRVEILLEGADLPDEDFSNQKTAERPDSYRNKIQEEK
ncbi:hypothetical protein CSB20_04335 [bacterium DOLZORAL124_64_63]|nr:MAG: hypothetical protein CSB20_04335 [bacterium DOLZORAL124_64_63]